jgi:glutaredoxin
MEFPGITLSSQGHYTIYSKSGCPNCNRVKDLLRQKSVDFVQHNCDEYLLEAKDEFLDFIARLAGKECRVFPMVFDATGAFVGGYAETKAVFDKQGLEFNADF